MLAKNWTKLYDNYKGKWVALKDDETTVISSGERLPEVIRTAQVKGYEKPVLAKIPKKDITYIGLS